ncbi:Transcriptional regulatory protein RcsB [compost metagenome]
MSAREREVIRCYLAGMTVTEIAEKFKRSIKTISSQKATAFRKLGVTSNNELFKIRHTIGEA